MNASSHNSLAVQYEDASVASLFAEEAWLAALLRVEIALARAQAKAGVIPESAAAVIAQRATSFRPDFAKLTIVTERDGFPIIGLVEQLCEHVGGEAAAYVHWGATTQDILDTALVCQLREGLVRIDEQLFVTCSLLATLAERYRSAICIGRTHLQWATPTTFGLKAAGWLVPLVRNRQRLRQLLPRLLVVQCGGAGGTLASLGSRGPEVICALAKELSLGVPLLPWHADRDSIRELADWLALVASSMAKFAHDVLLLAQSEITEVRESADSAGGGSSAMPQKRNPVLCERLLVAAHSAQAHRAALATAAPPEHERGTLTTQLEWLHLPRLMALAAGSCQFAVKLATGLVVDVDRMHANLTATHGVLLAEVAAIALRDHLGPETAKTLIRDACQTALTEKRHLIDLLRERVAMPIPWESLRDEANYLGSANLFIDAALAEAAAMPQPARFLFS